MLRKVLTNKKGTSLVEVLVTMVVLVMGIMVMVQMFPMGFSVVKMAESRTIASNMAQQELERWKLIKDNLPDGIVAIDDSDQYDFDIGSNIVVNYKAGPTFEATTEYPAKSGLYIRGNVLNLRQVVGEHTKIPVGSYFDTGNGSMYGARYNLAFSPIDAYRDANDVIQGIKVMSGDLRRRTFDKDVYPYPSMNASSYAIDYDGTGASFSMAFQRIQPGMPNRTYYVSYTYWIKNSSGNPEPVFVRNQSVVVNVGTSGYDGRWILVNIPAGTDFLQIDDYSDSCARGFVERSFEYSADKYWSDDPYEYTVADPILGVIAFNPLGHVTMESTSQGVKQLEARIDYRIYDTRILKEDRVIPNPGTAASVDSIKLSLKFLLALGNATDNPDEQKYEGLMRAETIGGVIKPIIGKPIDGSNVKALIPESMMIMDLATGLRVVPLDKDAKPLSVDTPSDKLVNFINGTVDFPVTSGIVNANLVDYTGAPVVSNINLAGRHIRFLYRADGDWSIQTQKAYSLYTRGDLPSYKGYSRDSLTLSSPDPKDYRLLFDRLYDGHYVAVDYSWVDSSGIERKIAGENHSITFDGNVNNYFPFIELKHTPSRINVVIGLSIKSRVIWRDSKGWRYVDNETALIK